MAYHHHHHFGHGYGYGWSPHREYEPYENGGMIEPPICRHFDGPPHPKGHHARLRSKEQEKEDIAEAEAGTQSLAETQRALESLRHRHRKDVNEEAEAFIKLEHRRIQLTKLMSMGAI